ncbi:MULTISPECIES: hypothetical protein [Chelativorans]|jgi:hypothetical protein|uniref:Uncharacterized protein n=1 Tax=Chelativorans sp. (strain BNC1) TaxID=266779 RepID=Q11AG7_CHESB|nr:MULTISPECIES: hypothetical protein [Chelativorans]
MDVNLSLRRDRLLILAGSASKRPDPGTIPARDRYDGPLWRTLRADPNGVLAKVGFLSARFGFRAADTLIKDCDARLTRELADRMIVGGMITRWPRPPSPNRPDNSGMHPGAEIASLCLTREGRVPFRDVALVGGCLYVEVMRAFLSGFQRMGCVAPDARIVEISAPIGIMRQRMVAWLNDPQGGRRSC